MWSAVDPLPADLVREAFGIEIGDLRSHPGGFEADAFTDGRWFVKWWRHQPDQDSSLALTTELARRGLPVPPALRTFDGGFTGEYMGRALAVFPFVAGDQATWEDAERIAEAMRRLHDVADLNLPGSDLEEECIDILRDRQDHPWLVDHRHELTAAVDRLEAVIDRARSIAVSQVICHRDLFPHNVLVDDRGRITALLDWGSAVSAPREHDLFVALCGPDPVRFLRAYRAEGLSFTHLTYARLARSLRDIAARVADEVDREGIETWGLEGLRRVDPDLALARPFCDD